MSRDYSRPSAWARWGWLAVAVNAVFVAVNVACLVLLDGGWLNWMAVVICTCSGIYSYSEWRDEVDRDRARRYVRARLSGDWR